ncbi:MAG: hypothetical protein U0451_03765 [Candidatus Saccharimonadales bacterium]
MVISVFVLLTIFIILIIITRTRKDSQNTNEYFDPGSGETISDPLNKTPETFNSDPDQPVFLGFSKLIDYGVTQHQIEGFKNILSMYSKANGSSIREASISVDTIKYDNNSDDPDSLIHFATFDMTINRTDKYTAKLTLNGINVVQLNLTKDGKVIYQSDNYDITETGD